MRPLSDFGCPGRTADLSVGGSAVFGVDEHSDLSPAEFSAALGSCSSSAPTPSEPAPAVKRSNFTFDAAADSIDWRAHGGKSYVTHVKNQGAFGTCSRRRGCAILPTPPSPSLLKHLLTVEAGAAQMTELSPTARSKPFDGTPPCTCSRCSNRAKHGVPAE